MKASKEKKEIVTGIAKRQLEKLPLQNFMKKIIKKYYLKITIKSIKIIAKINKMFFDLYFMIKRKNIFLKLFVWESTILNLTNG